MSSPLTPQGAAQEAFASSSYLTVPSFGTNSGDIPTSQELSYLDTQSLHVLDTSQFATIDSRTIDAAFYVPGSNMPFIEERKFSNSPAISGSPIYQSNFVNSMSQISLDM